MRWGRRCMRPSKVIRIDAQVWAELQRRARPLEDTPNSVLRRVFGLPEDDSVPARLEPRVTRLLMLVRDLVGQTPHVEAARKGYSFLSRTGVVVADIRPQKERLRAEASKTVAETAGLTTWEREGSEAFDGGSSVRWYAVDGDDTAFQHVATILATLWRSDPESGRPAGRGSPTALPSPPDR
jgi:antitoxin (DNA-binding transcriptional repressor) of toxin-antitoxin stability system